VYKNFVNALFQLNSSNNSNGTVLRKKLSTVIDDANVFVFFSSFFLFYLKHIS